MEGKTSAPLLNLFHTYISLEKTILYRVTEISYPFCAECKGLCCDKKICRESLESPFLSALIKHQGIQYDKNSGWMGPDGCRLAYGRPLVCHEFFCEKLLKNRGFQASNIREMVKAFVATGNRAFGSMHLISVYDLDLLTLKNILKINYKMEQLLENQRSLAAPVG